jgi:hypothetical protein
MWSLKSYTTGDLCLLALFASSSVLRTVALFGCIESGGQPPNVAVQFLQVTVERLNAVVQRLCEASERNCVQARGSLTMLVHFTALESHAAARNSARHNLERTRGAMQTHVAAAHLLSAARIDATY